MQVTEDFEDDRYAGRIGTVVDVVDERDPIYPHGRVAVRLVYDELFAKLYFKRDRVPQPIWFKPNYLERLDA